jgi:hypothetical protein
LCAHVFLSERKKLMTCFIPLLYLLLAYKVTEKAAIIRQINYEQTGGVSVFAFFIRKSKVVVVLFLYVITWYHRNGCFWNKSSVSSTSGQPVAILLIRYFSLSLLSRDTIETVRFFLTRLVFAWIHRATFSRLHRPSFRTRFKKL